MGLLPMGVDILPAYDDRVFKLILTSPEAEPVLMDLISSIIQRPVIGVIVRNNELPVGDVDEKPERLDINCTVDDRSQVDLAMQGSRIQENSDGEYRNLKRKSVYDVCDLYSSQSSKGVRRYDKRARAYRVTFCSYTVFPDRKDYINSFSMRHDLDNELLSDAIRVVYLELSKLDKIIKKSVSEMTDLEKWAVFFQYASEPTYRETLNKVIESKEVLQMAGSLLMNISQEGYERAVFRNRQMFQFYRESALATAEGREFEKGVLTGKAQRNIVFTLKLLKRNRPIEEIMELTGLNFKAVEYLRDITK